MADTKRRRRKKKAKWSAKKKIAVAAGSIIIALLLVFLGVAASKYQKIERIEIEPEVLEISIDEEVERKTGYVNVALFGLDSRNGNLGKGNRSDTMMIASLNLETYEVRLVSIYRDTLLKLSDGTYNKANAAYAFYGPEGAVTLLNQNLDMNIDRYVTVNFNALVDVIDALGGMDLTLTYEEVVHMNNYCVETSKVTGKSYKKIEPEKAGTYHLNGVQAVSYSRIRYTAGGDIERAARQRLVLSKIAESAQHMDLTAINKIIDSVFPQIATNFTLPEMLSYAKDFKQYRLGESAGFPVNRSSKMLHVLGSTEVANTLSSNVAEVHKFLFDLEEYEPSDTVKGIDKEIKNRLSSGYYDTPKEVVKPEEKPNDSKPSSGGNSSSGNSSSGSNSGSSGSSSGSSGGTSSGGSSSSGTSSGIYDEEYYYGDE